MFAIEKEWDPLYDKLYNLIFEYDLISFTKEEEEDFFNNYYNDEDYKCKIFIKERGLNDIGKLIYNMVLTGYIYPIDLCGFDIVEGWDYYINLDGTFVGDIEDENYTFIPENYEQASKRIYESYIWILNKYNKRFSFIKREYYKLLFNLKRFIIGKDIRHPKNIIGKYICKLWFIKNIKEKYIIRGWK